MSTKNEQLKHKAGSKLCHYSRGHSGRTTKKWGNKVDNSGN
jgi:hypothetical protein